MCCERLRAYVRYVGDGSVAGAFVRGSQLHFTGRRAFLERRAKERPIRHMTRVRFALERRPNHQKLSHSLSNKRTTTPLV